jgi:hypothetical protein
MPAPLRFFRRIKTRILGQQRLFEIMLRYSTQARSRKVGGLRVPPPRRTRYLNPRNIYLFLIVTAGRFRPPTRALGACLLETSVRGQRTLMPQNSFPFRTPMGKRSRPGRLKLVRRSRQDTTRDVCFPTLRPRLSFWRQRIRNKTANPCADEEPSLLIDKNTDQFSVSFKIRISMAVEVRCGLCKFSFGVGK